MKTIRQVWVSLATLLAACLVQAADSKPIARVLSIIDVETDDPSGYATWIAQYNQIAKAKLGVDDYLRVFETVNDGKKAGRLRAVVTASSVVEMTKNARTMEGDLAVLQSHLRGIRQLGARALFQAVRFEGSDKHGWVYSTLAVVGDEAGYLKALDQLRALFDANGLKDAKINVYRVIAGRSDHTHRINISVPSEDRLAALLDFTATSSTTAEWIASAAKYRTVVSNTTSREITK